MTSQNNDLTYLINDDTISSSEALNIVQRMKRKTKLKKEFQDKIKRRADGKQYYIYKDRKQYSAKTEEQLLDILYELYYGKEQWSMSDIFPLWMMWKRDYTPVSGRTLKNYSGEWHNFIAPYEIATKPIKELTAKDFTRLFRLWTCKGNMTLKKFNNLKSLINGIYSYAINEAEIVAINPIREIDRKQFTFKAVNNDDDVFSIEDRTKLLKYLEDNDDIYSLAIQFDFQVTMRIGELLSLKWSNIKNDQIYINSQFLVSTQMNDDLTFSKYYNENSNHVKGNTNEGFRFIPLTSKAKEILEKVKMQNPDGEYIFMRRGKQLHKGHFNEHLVKYCDEAGVEPHTSHKIRFTVASMLYLNGMPLPDLQRLLGHTTTQMTLHYIRKVTNNNVAFELMEKCLN